MSSFEFNKVFAAVLVAGIVAMLSGFIAHKVVHPRELDKDVVVIEGGAAESGGASAPAGPEPILDLIATADIAKGEKLSKACAACHSFDKGGVAKVGPNLWGVVGASKAAHADFAYSDAMKEHGGIWSYEELNHFLWKPKSFVPGTKMAFIGLKKPEDRAAVIAWLHTLGSGVPMPTEAQIAAEKADLAPEEPEESPADLSPELAPTREGVADKPAIEENSEN